MCILSSSNGDSADTVMSGCSRRHRAVNLSICAPLEFGGGGLQELQLKAGDQKKSPVCRGRVDQARRSLNETSLHKVRRNDDAARICHFHCYCFFHHATLLSASSGVCYLSRTLRDMQPYIQSRLPDLPFCVKNACRSTTLWPGLRFGLVYGAQLSRRN